MSAVTSVLTDAVMRRVTHDGPVNLAFGSRTTLRELIALIEELVGTPLTVDELPERAGDVRHSQADSTMLHSLFPDIEPIGLRDALVDTVNWFRESQ